jgi:hypothetical protein
MDGNNQIKTSYFIRIAMVSILLWSLTLGSLLYWSINNEILQSSELAKSQTRAFFQDFLMARLWNTFHGGVYVPVSDTTPPNPYLKDDPNRDLVSTSGINLTKLNPAYMTRQIAGVAKERTQIDVHLTGLDPINPSNSADPWEEKALQQLSDKTEYFELVKHKDGKKLFRYMSPLIIEAECLDCHEKYGGEEGKQHGGISISIPAQPIIDSQSNQIMRFMISYLIIWFVGIACIWSCTARMTRNYKERSITIQKLQDSLKKVKKLSGMLPICCSCKKIRNDEGYWDQIEQYIGEHADIQFSHGICPDCSKKLYPDFCK